MVLLWHRLLNSCFADFIFELAKRKWDFEEEWQLARARDKQVPELPNVPPNQFVRKVVRPIFDAQFKQRMRDLMPHQKMNYDDCQRVATNPLTSSAVVRPSAHGRACAFRNR